MPLLNFQSRFAPHVESGEKRQTIRAYRKDGRDPKVGDRLYLYTGARTKACRKLGEATVRRVTTFEIEAPVLAVGGKIYGIRDRRIRAIALRDGFSSADAMVHWFRKVHGFPFRGLLIEWDEIERARL